MKYISIFCVSIFTLACASGPCPHQVKSDQPAATQPQTSASSATSTEAQDPSKVRVFKADGSQQCGQGKAIDLKVMEKDLAKAGVKVLSSSKQSDGMMHPQVCGAATGKANTYEINSEDLKKAEKLGFKRWQP